MKRVAVLVLVLLSGCTSPVPGGGMAFTLIGATYRTLTNPVTDCIRIGQNVKCWTHFVIQ